MQKCKGDIRAKNLNFLIKQRSFVISKAKKKEKEMYLFFNKVKKTVKYNFVSQLNVTISKSVSLKEIKDNKKISRNNDIIYQYLLWRLLYTRFQKSQQNILPESQYLLKNQQLKENVFLFTRKKNIFLKKNNSFFSFFKADSNKKLKYFFPYQKSFLCYWLLPFVGFVFTLNQQRNLNLVNNLQKIDINLFTIIYKNQNFSNNSTYVNKNILFYLVPKTEIKSSILFSIAKANNQKKQQNLIHLNMNSRKPDNFFTSDFCLLRMQSKDAHKVSVSNFVNDYFFMNFTNQIANNAILYLKSLENFIEFSSNALHSKNLLSKAEQQQKVRKKILKSFWLNLDIVPIYNNKTPFFFINELKKPEFRFYNNHNNHNNHTFVNLLINKVHDVNVVSTFASHAKQAEVASQNNLNNFFIKNENKKNRYLQALFFEEKLKSDFLHLNINYSKKKQEPKQKIASNIKLPLSSYLKLEFLFNNFIKKELLEFKPYLFKTFFKKEISNHISNKTNFFKNNNPVSVLYLENKIINTNKYETINNDHLINPTQKYSIYYQRQKSNNKVRDANFVNITNNFIEKNLFLLKEWPNFFSKKLGFASLINKKIKNNLNYKKLSKEQLYKLLFNSLNTNFNFINNEIILPKEILISTTPTILLTDPFLLKQQNDSYVNKTETSKVKNPYFVSKELENSNLKNKKMLIFGIFNPCLVCKAGNGKNLQKNPFNLYTNKEIKSVYPNLLKIKEKKLKSHLGYYLLPLSLQQQKNQKNKQEEDIKNEYINYSFFIKKINFKLKNLFIKKQLKNSAIFTKYLKLKNLKLKTFKDFFVKNIKTSHTYHLLQSKTPYLFAKQKACEAKVQGGYKDKPYDLLFNKKNYKTRTQEKELVTGVNYMNLSLKKNSQEKMEKLLRTYFSIKNKSSLTIKEKKLTKNSLYNLEKNQRKIYFYKQIKQEIINKFLFFKISVDFNNLFKKQNKDNKLSVISLSQSEYKKKNKMEEKIYSPNFLIKNRSFILTSTSKSKLLIANSDTKQMLKKNASFSYKEVPFFLKFVPFITDYAKGTETIQKRQGLIFETLNPDYDGLLLPFAKQQAKRNKIEKLTNSTSIVESEITKTFNEINLEKQRKYIQKKRRRKKLKKETRRRKKRKRFYPRPIWLRYRSFLKFLNKRKKEYLFNHCKGSFEQGNSLFLTKIKKTKTKKVLKQNQREKLLRKYYPFSYNFYLQNKTASYFDVSYYKANTKNQNQFYITNKDQQTWPLFINEKHFSGSNEIQNKSENIFSMHITNKENFIIARSILIDFKRLLWKSYWLRSNLNPYLKKVKNFLIKIKESKQKWEFFQNLNIFLNYMAGFNIKTKYLNNNYSNQLIINKYTSKAKHDLTQWENTLYFAEYNRITYYRIQEFISQIRENFATLLTNKNKMNSYSSMSLQNKKTNIKTDDIGTDNVIKKSLKVRSSHLSHSKMQDNKRQNIISRRKTTDFWVKLGKAFMPDSQSSTISGGVASQAQINEKTYFKKRKEWWLLPNYILNNSKAEPTNPQIRIIWALSKITPSLNSHLSISDGLINRDPNNKSKTNLNSFLYKRRKTWSASPESSKFREQTKYNKTKKMYRDLSIKLQTLLNEQNEFLFKLYPISFEKNKNNLASEAHFVRDLHSEKANKVNEADIYQNENNISNNKTLSIFEKRFFNNNNANLSLNTNYANETTSSEIRLVSENNKNSVLRFIAKGKEDNSNANISLNNQLLNKLFKKVCRAQRSKEDKSNFLNKNQTNSIMITQKGLRLYKKMIQINKNLKKNNNFIEGKYSSEFFLKEQSWFNNLTNKTSFVFWWTIYTNKFKNIFNFLPQKEEISYPIPFSSKTNLFVLSKINGIKEKQFSLFNIRAQHNKEQEQNEFFLKTAWICSLLFHFCSILSLISFSQIRDLLKFYLLGISKIYKISLGLLEYIYNSYNRFKLLTQINKYEIRKNNKVAYNEKKAFLILDKILINYLNQPTSINLVKNFINKNKIFALFISQRKKKQFFSEIALNNNNNKNNNNNNNNNNSSFEFKKEQGVFNKITNILLYSTVRQQGLKNQENILQLKANLLTEYNPLLKNYERKNQSFLALKILTNIVDNDVNHMNYNKKEANKGRFENLENFIGFADNQKFEKNKKDKLSFYIEKTPNIVINKTKKVKTLLFFIKNFLANSITFASIAKGKDVQNNIYYKKQNKNNYNLLTIKNNKILYLKNYTILYSLFLLNFIIKNFYGFTIATNNFLKQSFDLIGRFAPKSVFNFLEKPGELIIDWIAYMFLVEWSSDLTNTIPENVDIYLGTSYYKFIRTFHSLNLINVLQSLDFYQKAMINNNISLITFNLKNTNHIIKDNFYWQNLGTEQKVIISNLNLSILNLASTFIQNRIYHLYEILLFQFYQPDSDLIIRQKKGIIFWDIWGDFLMQVAEDSNINISELTSLKEEQIKLLEKSLSVEIKQPVLSKNSHLNTVKMKKMNSNFTNNFYINSDKKRFLFLYNSFNLLKFQYNNSSSFSNFGLLHMRNKGQFNQNEKHKISLSFLLRSKKNSRFNKIPFFAAKQFDLQQVINGNNKANNIGNNLQKTNILNPGYKETNNFAAQQFLSYQGKDTELFIDLHPPKSFTMISLLKKNESVQTSIGSLVCQIFSGIMSKQISKNILVVGNTNQNLSSFNETSEPLINELTPTSFFSVDNKKKEQDKTGFINNQIYSNVYQNNSLSKDNQHEKTLLIQAIAGETELKIITDNAYRYAMVYRGVAVGIKLLRDVFDSLSLHTPCLFLIEDIHAIGERRPLLISDDEKGSSPNGKPVFGSQREEIHEKNQVLYQLSKHVISHYRKPYKGDFSLLIPTNHFCFDLFKPNIDSFNINKINPSSLSFPSAKIFVQSKSSNDSNQILNDSLSTKEKNIYKSRLLIKSSQLFSPPATSPFSVLNLKEQKKFQPYKIVSEMPWGTGLRQSSEQIAQLSKASYSIRVKVAVLADMAISTLSVKLDMITDLLVIIDSVKGNRGFVVFATTHIPYILDPALRRPGRLDETITLGLFPRLLSRWNILKSSFGLFKAGKQQTGFKNGLSLDLTYSIQNSTLPYLISSVFYSSNSSSIFTPLFLWSKLTKKTLVATQIPIQNEQLFTNNPLSYSFFTKNKNISKNFFTLISVASNKYQKSKEAIQNTKFVDSTRSSRFMISNVKNSSYNHTINHTKNYTKIYRNNKKRIKILSQTYFIASNLLYESNINIINITNTNTNTNTNININTNINTNSFNLHKIELSPSKNIKLKENFLDFLQPLNIETSLLYMSLYTSPKQFQNSIIKLMSGKLGEIFLFSNFRLNNLYKLKNKNVPLNFRRFVPAQTQRATEIKNIKIKQNSLKHIEDFTSFGLSNSWKILSSLILSFIQKRYLYTNNLIITKFIDFNNKNSSCPKGEVPSPPSSNIFLPARRYENYRRSFAFFASRNTSIGILEKIQTHQQQRLIKRLYGFTVKETFKSEVLENRFTSFTNANLMIGSFSSLLQKPSNSNWFFKNRILMRHKNYLTNQWWNAQLPEHNAETTFLSDIDWRYTFVELIGDLLLDFPDTDQHYNPKNRRWLLTKGDYHNWFNFEKNFYNEIYTHFIFNSFIKAYNLFEKNREVLDFYAFYILQKGLYNCHTLNEFEIIKLYKRFL